MASQTFYLWSTLRYQNLSNSQPGQGSPKNYSISVPRSLPFYLLSLSNIEHGWIQCISQAIPYEIEAEHGKRQHPGRE